MNWHLGWKWRALIAATLVAATVGYAALIGGSVAQPSALEVAAATMSNPLLITWVLLPAWLFLCLMRSGLIRRIEFVVRFSSPSQHWWHVTREASVSAGVGVLMLGSCAVVVGTLFAMGSPGIGSTMPPPVLTHPIAADFLVGLFGLTLSATVAASIISFLTLMRVRFVVIGASVALAWIVVASQTQWGLGSESVFMLVQLGPFTWLGWSVAALVGSVPLIVLTLKSQQLRVTKFVYLLGSYSAGMFALALLISVSGPRRGLSAVLSDFYGNSVGALLRGAILSLVFLTAALIDQLTTPDPKGRWYLLSEMREGSLFRVVLRRVSQIGRRAAVLALLLATAVFFASLVTGVAGHLLSDPFWPAQLFLFTIAAFFGYASALCALAMFRQMAGAAGTAVGAALLAVAYQFNLSPTSTFSFTVRSEFNGAGSTLLLLSLQLLMLTTFIAIWLFLISRRKNRIGDLGMDEAYVTLESVGKHFRDSWLYTDVSLRLEPGQIYGLAGPNGSGKSVLLRIISGLTIPDQGTVRVRKDLMPRGRMFPSEFGIMIDGPGYLPGISGFQNLQELARIRRRIETADIEKVMTRIGLDPTSKKRVSRYSAGMKQKLGIAQALMEDPKVLILDEPFNALDASSTKTLRVILNELKTRDVCVVLTSHVDNELESTADVIFDIDNYRVVRREAQSTDQ